MCWLLCVSAHAATPADWLKARVDAVTPQTAAIFVTSYDVDPGQNTFDLADANAAYTYDQALAIMAFVAHGNLLEARRLGDATLFAQLHDRQFHDGRLRNAYASGIVVDAPVKLPGYWDKSANKWIEDGYQTGSATGNNAWIGLALMRLATASGDRRYAEGARTIGRWLIDVVGDDNGIPGGFEGFDQSQERLTWRSTEHNTAALALFRLLDKAYPGQGFGKAATSCERFIQSMWNGTRFEVGTLPDGTTVNTSYSSLDAQILSLLALNPAKPEQLKALVYAERTHGVPGGFDYSDAKAGIWAEGTMEAADFYMQLSSRGLTTGSSKIAKLDPATKSRDDNEMIAQRLIAGRLADQGTNGGIFAIQGLSGNPIAELATGLKQGNGEGPAWSYFRRVHIAPTAWLIMAQHDYNPLARPAP